MREARVQVPAPLVICPASLQTFLSSGTVIAVRSTACSCSRSSACRSCSSACPAAPPSSVASAPLAAAQRQGRSAGLPRQRAYSNAQVPHVCISALSYFVSAQTHWQVITSVSGLTASRAQLSLLHEKAHRIAKSQALLTARSTGEVTLFSLHAPGNTAQPCSS